MGYPEVPLDPIECFLKKGGGIHPERIPAKKECLLQGRAKPPVPKHNVECKTKDNSHINFRVKNIKQAIHLKPQRPAEPKLVDSPRGHRINAYDTKFKCVHHKKFGNMPKYLVRQNNEILKTEMEYKHALETAEPLCKPISVEERQALLDVSIVLPFIFCKLLLSVLLSLNLQFFVQLLNAIPLIYTLSSLMEQSR